MNMVLLWFEPKPYGKWETSSGAPLNYLLKHSGETL